MERVKTVNEESQAIQVAARFGAGSRVAGYLIEEQIGQGGMAVVFRAHDERLDRTVALKILAPALAADDAFRQRFIRESRAAAAVDDPHIIPVFEAGESSGVLFIAMRFVRGGDVRSLVGPAGLPPVDRVADIIAQAASALDAAHARGLVHRDVKPANMLLDAGSSEQDRADHVYLSDFGLSKWSLQTSGLTETGTFLGTLDYIAPEQIEGRAVDGRADQYSLACAAFELLSGSPPFRRPEAMAVMHAQVSEPPPNLTERRADLPGTVNQVFARAMAKVPAERFPSCRQFAAALRAGLGLGLGASGRDGAVGRDGAARHPATEAVVMAGTSVPIGEDAAATQAATPRQPVSFVPPAMPTMPPAMPMPPAMAMPPGATRNRPQVSPVLLVAASIVLAAGIVGGAIIFRSPGSNTAGLAGTSPSVSSPSVSSPSGTATPGQVRPSASPAGQGGAGGAGSGDGQAKPAADGQAGYRLGGVLNPGAEGSITSVAWNPAGTLVATSDKNGSTYVWHVAGGRQAAPPLAGPGKAFAAAFSPDGTELATGYSNGATYLWDYKTGRLVTTLRDPGGANGKEVDSVAFSPDGRTLATSDGNGYTNVWSVPPGADRARLVVSLADPAGAGVFSVAFSPDGRTMATGDYDGHVYIWDVASDTTTATFALAGGSCPTTICAAVSALAFSGDGGVLAAGNESGNAELWRLAAGTGSPIDPPAAAAGQSIWAFSFAGSALLAMADADGHAYLYRLPGRAAAPSVVGALTDPDSGSASGNLGVGALAFSADGRYLVTGDTNGNAYLWHTG